MLDTNICIYIIKNKPLNVKKNLKVIILAKLQYRALQFPSFITEFIKILNKSKIY